MACFAGILDFLWRASWLSLLVCLCGLWIWHIGGFFLMRRSGSWLVLAPVTGRLRDNILRLLIRQLTSVLLSFMLWNNFLLLIFHDLAKTAGIHSLQHSDSGDVAYLFYKLLQKGERPAYLLSDCVRIDKLVQLRFENIVLPTPLKVVRLREQKRAIPLKGFLNNGRPILP